MVYILACTFRRCITDSLPNSVMPSFHTLVEDANDYTALAANLTIAAAGPAGTAVVFVGKLAGKTFASKVSPWIVLSDVDQKLQHVFNILDEMKDIMSVKEHDELHDLYDT